MTHDSTFLKVASKQAEIAIGQIAFTEAYYQQVDFLPPMSFEEMIISQRKPKEIVSFKTLIYPLDNYVWAFILLSSTVMFIALILVRKGFNLMMGQAIPSQDNYRGAKNLTLEKGFLVFS